MTKREAAMLVASRNPADCTDNAAKMCDGIRCGECFNCKGFATFGMNNAQAAVYVYDKAVAWLAANPEPETKKEVAE